MGWVLRSLPALMFKGSKCLSITVVAQLVRVKATVRKGLRDAWGSAVSCSCEDPREGEREASAVMSGGATRMMGWEMKAEFQGSRLTFSAVHLLLLLQVNSWDFLLSNLLPKNEVRRREGRFPRAGFVDPTLWSQTSLKFLEAETLSHWVSNLSCALLKWVKKVYSVKYDLSVLRSFMIL